MQQMRQLTHDQTLREQETLHRQEIDFKRDVDALELEHIRAKNEEQAGLLSSMLGMKVDLTRYLVAQYQNPDRLIRIDGPDNGQLHVHEQ